MNYRCQLFIVFVICTLHYGCNETKGQTNFKDFIKTEASSDFSDNFREDFSKALRDSIFSKGSTLYLSPIEEQNSLSIENVISDANNDAIVYAILINKASMEGVFKNKEGACDFYSILGVQIDLRNNELNFNSDNIDVYEFFNNCKNSDKTSLEELRKDYHKYIYETIEKTNSSDFPENSGIVILKKMYEESKI